MRCLDVLHGKRPLRGQSLHFCELFLCFCATHFVDDRTGVQRHFIGPPGDVAVRPHQNQSALVELHRLRFGSR